MGNESKKRILIDTNFLIALDNQEDEYHQNAEEYLDRFIINENKVYLSSIVMFEFLLNHKNDKWQEQIKEFIKLDFSFLDSQKLNLFKDKRDYQQLSGQLKHCAKDDDKIIAQCIHNRIDIFITRDKKLIAFIEDNIANIEINQTSYTLRCIDFETPVDNQQLKFDWL